MAAGLENIGKTCFKYIQEFSIGLSVPLPPFSSSAPQNPEDFS